MSTLNVSTIIPDAGGSNVDLSISGKGTGRPDLQAGFKVGGTAGVDVASLRTGTDGELITWDASGNPATVAVGTSTHVLTSNGAGAAPTFQTPTAAAGSVYASAYIFSGSQSFSRGTYAIITGWGEYTDSGSFFNPTTGVFTVPTDEGGKYFFAANWGCDFNSIGSDGERIEIRFSNNAGTPAGRGGTAYYMTTGTANMRYGTVYTNYMASLSAGDEVALQGYWLDVNAVGGSATVEDCNMVGFKVAD